MSPIWVYALIAVGAYLLGCVSTGLILSERKAGLDIREVGSKSTGASNVLRVFGMKLGLVTFLCDFLKAVIACLVARWAAPVGGGEVAALFVVMGHNWPVFTGFRGGKGVACTVGILLSLYPVLGLIAIVACCLVIALTKYISLGSMTMTVVFLGLVIGTRAGDWLLAAWALALAALCVFQHRANIRRLLAGTENKFGRRVAVPAADAARGEEKKEK